MCRYQNNLRSLSGSIPGPHTRPDKFRFFSTCTRGAAKRHVGSRNTHDCDSYNRQRPHSRATHCQGSTPTLSTQSRTICFVCLHISEGDELPQPPARWKACARPGSGMYMIQATTKNVKERMELTPRTFCKRLSNTRTETRYNCKWGT